MTEPRRRRSRSTGSNVVPLKDSGLDDSGYSRDKFYVRGLAKNEHDHGINVPRFKVRDSFHARIKEVVNSGTFPDIRHEADLWRDAMYHRLHDLADMLKDRRLIRALRSELAKVELAEQIAKDRVDLADYERMEREIGEFFLAARQHSGSYARERLESYEERAHELPEPFRTRLIEKIRHALKSL